MLLRGLAHEGVHAFALDYLSAPFLGRHNDLHRLLAFARSGPPFVLLSAPAGRGKSALLFRLALHLDQNAHLVAWLPISLRFGSHRSATLDSLLSARLSSLLGKHGHWRDLLQAHQGPPLLLVLDGLDELQDEPLLDALTGLHLPASVRLLASARPTLGRDGRGWQERLRWQPCEQLTLDPLSTDDLEAFAATAASTAAATAGSAAPTPATAAASAPALAAASAASATAAPTAPAPAAAIAAPTAPAPAAATAASTAPTLAAATAASTAPAAATAPATTASAPAAAKAAAEARALGRELAQRTGGDPLLVRLCVEALRQGLPLPDVSDPAELVGAWWDEQRARLGAPDDERALRALAALGAAAGVVPWGVLARVVGASEAETRRALGVFERFVVEVEGRGVSFGHPRFAEVARWRFASEVQQAQERFASVAMEERKKAEPEPYFLHFAVTHLASVGAPDEAFDALLTRESLRAWRRHEGGVTGFLGEVRAAWERSERSLQAAWGTEAALGQIERQSKYLALEHGLRAQEAGQAPELRAALVAHGLRDLDSALAAVAELDPDDTESRRSEAVEALLPLVPDAALPRLLALATERTWPRRRVVEELHRRGLTDLALAHLLEAPSHMERPLLGLSPALTHQQRAQAARAVFSTSSEHMDEVLPLLHPDERRLALDTIEREASTHRDALRGAWLRGRLALACARLGDTAAAMSHLSTIEQALALPLSEADHRSLRGTLIETCDALIEKLPEPERTQCLALLQRLSRAGRLTVASLCSLLRWVPEAWEEARHAAPDNPWSLWSHPALPDWLVPQLEEPMHQAIERYLRPEHASFLSVLGGALAMRPLRDRDRFFTVVPTWASLASDDEQRRGLAAAIVGQADQAHHELARQHLLALANQGAPLWRVRGWERFLHFDERRALLARRLAASSGLPEPSLVCDELAVEAQQLRELGESEACAALERAVQTLGRGLPEALPALLATSPPGRHGALLDELLEGLMDFPYNRADHVLRALRDDALRARVARRWLALPHRSPLPRWPTEVMAALPPSERPGAEAALAAKLRDNRVSLPFDENTPEPLRNEQWGALLGRHPDPLAPEAIEALWGVSLLVEHGEAYRAAAKARLWQALQQAPDQHALAKSQDPHWRALRAVMRSLDERELCSLDDALPRAPLGVQRAAAYRAWLLLEQVTSEPLVSLFLSCSDALQGQPGMAFRAALWRHRALPPDAQLEAAIDEVFGPGTDDPTPPRSDWTSPLSVLARFGLQDAAARRAARWPPAQRLDLLSRLWTALSEPTQADLLPALEEAASLAPERWSLESLAEVLSERTLRGTWGRHVLGPSWWVPARWLKRLGGQGALASWARGAERGFALFAQASGDSGNV